jgi:hypothetical protein
MRTCLVPPHSDNGNDVAPVGDHAVMHVDVDLDAASRPVLRGLELRSLLVVLLLHGRRPMTVRELVAGAERSGFAFAGRPSKDVADALRWEVARGRALRVGRGVYTAGRVAKTTRHRMHARVARARSRSR